MSQPYTANEPETPAMQPPQGPHAVDGLMTDVIFTLRVTQLTTILRAQALSGEALTMLGMLESLVIAGEIPFPDFMRRVQNLFPDVFDKIDAELREKLLAMLSD